MNRRDFSNFDFAYWLQGAIEIGGITGYADEHIIAIKRRYNDVVEKDAFCFRVWFIVNFLPKQEAFDAINAELQQMFIHYIDPSYEGDLEYRLDVHEGKIVLDARG